MYRITSLISLFLPSLPPSAVCPSVCACLSVCRSVCLGLNYELSMQVRLGANNKPNVFLGVGNSIFNFQLWSCPFFPFPVTTYFALPNSLVTLCIVSRSLWKTITRSVQSWPIEYYCGHSRQSLCKHAVSCHSGWQPRVKVTSASNRHMIRIRTASTFNNFKLSQKLYD